MRLADATPVGLSELAAELAVAAGRLALEGRRSLPAGGVPTTDTKSSATDPVTEFDRAAEYLIVTGLRERRPDDAIVGEEGTDDAGTTGIAWHIDPIDGTANFLYDLPGWSCSVAAVDADGPIAGAVHLPVTGELFQAARGHGATLDGRPISASTVSELSLAMVATGFSYLADRRAVQAERLRHVLPLVRDIRRLGSAAIDLCYVGCGRVDAYFEEHLNSWDLAAGLLVAIEAGAVASDFRGGPVVPQSVVVAAPGVHRALLTAIDGA